MNEKKIMEEIQRIYEVIGDLEAKKLIKCDRCGISIKVGHRYFKTKLKEYKSGVIINERDIMTLCRYCARVRK